MRRCLCTPSVSGFNVCECRIYSILNRNYKIFTFLEPISIERWFLRKYLRNFNSDDRENPTVIGLYLLPMLKEIIFSSSSYVISLNSNNNFSQL